MNDQAILEQLAQHPASRAVQLADRLDLDLVDVQTALAGLQAVGDVVGTPGKSPAGNDCQFYALSQKFMATDAYKPLAVRAAAANFRAGHADLNKTDRAIAFIRAHGKASSFELHVVMDLKPSDQASNYLKQALTDGRLARDDKNWVLGPASLQAPAGATNGDTAQPSASGTIETGGAALPVERVASPPAPANAGTTARQPSRPRARPAELKAEAPNSPVYRCALWSDGILEVQRDGQTVAAMEQAAGESLRAFLGRLAGAPAPA